MDSITMTETGLSYHLDQWEKLSCHLDNFIFNSKCVKSVSKQRFTLQQLAPGEALNWHVRSKTGPMLITPWTLNRLTDKNFEDMLQKLELLWPRVPVFKNRWLGKKLLFEELLTLCIFALWSSPLLNLPSLQKITSKKICGMPLLLWLQFKGSRWDVWRYLVRDLCFVRPVHLDQSLLLP